MNNLYYRRDQSLPDGKHMYSFKDFLVADIAEGEDEYIQYRAQKRRRGVMEETEELEEALDNTQRLKRSQLMRRLKSKLKLGRQKASKKSATAEKLKARAQRRARLNMFKKMTMGKDKSQMSLADRKAIEKRLDSKKNIIDRMAKKLLPQVRKDDRERKQSVGK